ncbi:transcription cofactor HES-6-like [Clupea harengus]|uniref:Transcription cofactor HES-6 n=1 Tax=Clupea harengus TaxID=7950 RepID=A0A6P8G044_CLUHA|nr:transcription cofactor HES-6-like [Clupea harengus]
MLMSYNKPLRCPTRASCLHSLQPVPSEHTHTHTHTPSLFLSKVSGTDWREPFAAMGPSARGPGFADDDSYGTKNNRKTRKPLVEKRRRARINESLQELRMLLADSELSAKMENADVLEMTVKRVEQIVQDHTQAGEAEPREESERFAAGYIQGVHQVHTFLSAAGPGLDGAVATDLLSHLLECMPLSREELADATLHQEEQEELADSLLDSMLHQEEQEEQEQEQEQVTGGTSASILKTR